MKATELLETTDDDRKIISMASSILHKARIAVGENPKQILGKVKDLVNDPMPELADIYIRIKPLKTYSGAFHDDVKKPYIILNSNELFTKLFVSTISHELRHALDHAKSKGVAMQSDRYRSPMKRQLNGKDLKRTERYESEPAEINARVVEVMQYITLVMLNQFNRDPNSDLRQKGMDAMWKGLERERILKYFPEKEKSKKYKRIINRITQYIEYEVNRFAKMTK